MNFINRTLIKQIGSNRTYQNWYWQKIMLQWKVKFAHFWTLNSCCLQQIPNLEIFKWDMEFPFQITTDELLFRREKKSKGWEVSSDNYMFKSESWQQSWHWSYVPDVTNISWTQSQHQIWWLLSGSGEMLLSISGHVSGTGWCHHWCSWLLYFQWLPKFWFLHFEHNL